MLLRTRFEAKFQTEPANAWHVAFRHVPNGTLVLLLQDHERTSWNDIKWARVLWEGQEWWVDSFFLEGLEGEKIWKAVIE